jgi:uncharacterized protein YdiU (UPF0061 family)
MSILGLTIDYGPFGFLDFYDPDFVSSTVISIAYFIRFAMDQMMVDVILLRTSLLFANGI